MKKKLITLATGLVCVVTCAFAFAACDKPHAHDYRWVDNGDGTHKQHCSVDGCDAPDINAGSHDYGENGVCVCGKTHTHDYRWVDNGDGTHKQHCSVDYCDVPDISAGSHDYGENGVCVCGKRLNERIADAAAWRAAFDFSEVDNATLVFTGWEGGDTVDTCVFDGMKFKRTVTLTQEGQDLEEIEYLEYRTDEIFDQQEYGDRGTVYTYVYDDATESWTYTRWAIFGIRNVQDYLYDDSLENLETEDGKTVGDRFADAVFDEQTYKYSIGLEMEGAELIYTFEFRNGKVYRFVLSGTVDSEELAITTTVIDIGTSVVTLPQATEKTN